MRDATKISGAKGVVMDRKRIIKAISQHYPSFSVF